MGNCGWKKNAESKKSKKKKNQKCGWQKNNKKINKQTIKERNLSFKSLSHGWTLHLHTERDANSWHSFSILKRCNSRSSLSLLSGVIAIFFNIYFIRNFIVITLRRGGMISLLSLDIVYSTYRKNILRAIKSRLICLSGSRQKKLQYQPEKRPNVPIWQMPINSAWSAYHVDLFFTSSTLWEFISARIMSSNF